MTAVNGGLMERIAQAMAAGSPWLLPLAFVAGLGTSLNPCAYPLMAAVAGYVWAHGGGRRGRSALIAGAFVLGLALTYSLLGAIGGFVGPLLGLTPRAWAWLVGAVCIAAGLVMAQVLPLEFAGVSALERCWGRLHGLPGALVIGALLGLVATPCATPPLAVIVSLAAARQAAGLGAVLLFAYALGHAVPAVAMGLVAGGLSAFDRMAPYGRGLQLAGGWLIIAVGFYLIIRS
ncbi:MAG: cytochrome c biogenesis CcdA family protein [Armatimonadota bacterium]